MKPILEIVRRGSVASFQDAGRPGWRRFGVPAGGCMDPASAERANLLLGNREDAVVLELGYGGLHLRVLEATCVALAGADLGCAGIAQWTARPVAAGEELIFTGGSMGTWAYIAVPGGFMTQHWFGSASSDARNGLGQGLEDRDQLSCLLAEPRCQTERVSRRILVEEERLDFSAVEAFDLFAGPDVAVFTAKDLEQMVTTDWKVSARSDRTGYRLDGPALTTSASLPSQPILPGAIQVPGGGQPIVMMPDGPTVGGYAQIALIDESDLGRFAQCRAGTTVKFRWKDY